MNLKNNQGLMGVLFLILWIGAILVFSDKVAPDLRSNDLQRGGNVGHPLWQD